MSTTTNNYSFVKPDVTDVPDITVLSQNWDVLDSALNLIDDRNKVTTIDVADEDINAYSEQGIYLFDTYSPVNAPMEDAQGWLLVIPWANNYEGMQIWVGRDASNVDTLFVRSRNYPSWTNWKQIYTEVQINTLRAEMISQIEANRALSMANEQKIKSNKQEIDSIKAAVGTPLQASTVASMTDTTKIYVYTGSETGYTAGNWYYYNGTAWVSGGVYNSTAVEITDYIQPSALEGTRYKMVLTNPTV